jgi:replicative DNA helicase
MFIYRDEYYLERAEPQQRQEESSERFDQRYDSWQQRFESTRGLADVIVTKQRHGPIGNVKLRFEAETTSFTSYAQSTRLPEQSL